MSAHVVRQVASALPLFGTTIYPKIIASLRPLKRPVWLWLDWDKVGEEVARINRLQTFLDVPVRVVRTEKDPKWYKPTEIKEILGSLTAAATRQ